jgi:hypothetical protein
LPMADIGLAEYFGIGEAIAIIATFLVTLYFSRKEIKSLRVDLESKVLNDLNEQIHGMGDMLVERPDLIKILNKNQSERSPEMVFVYYILYMCAHAFHMRQRKILSDNEWAGWMRWIQTAFEQGEIRDYWKIIEPERWFDPAFKNFVDNEVIRGG